MYFKGTDPAVAKILSAAYGVRVGTVEVIAQETIHLTGRYWDDGAKTDYALVDLGTGRANIVPGASPFEKDPIGHELKMVPNIAVCVRQYGRGGPWYRIVVHPASMPKALPPAVDLTWAERVVLVATRRLKSSYGGIPNFRFVEARRETKITAMEWEEAKAALIARGLLSKVGAITPDGRNAVGEASELYNLPRPAAAPVPAHA